MTEGEMPEQEETRFDVFISYAHADNAPGPDGLRWVDELRDRLVDDFRGYGRPLRTFLDSAGIASMDDWRRRILVALRQSRVLLVCLSPNYFASEYCRLEFEEYLARQARLAIGDDTIAAVYFVEVPTADASTSDAWRRRVMAAQHVDLLEWFPHGARALHEEAVKQRISLLGTTVWDRIDRSRRAAAVPGNIPPVNPYFVGRTAELARLHDVLTAGRVGDAAVVNGIGGMGKSELLVQYAHSFRFAYPAGVWRVGAEKSASTLDAVASLVGEPALELPLDIAQAGGPEEVGRRVMFELRRRATEVGGPALLILDNVEDPALLSPAQLDLLGADGELALAITTRLGSGDAPLAGARAQWIPVGELSPSDALTLIRDHQPSRVGGEPAFADATEEESARRIIEYLEGLTLAVEQLAVLLGLVGAPTPTALLADLRRSGPGGIDVVADVAGDSGRALRSILDETVADLTRVSPPAMTALWVAARLPPDRIPWEWVQAVTERRHPELAERQPFRPDPWLTVRHLLEGRRLLGPTDDPELARMHRRLSEHVERIYDRELYEVLAEFLVAECLRVDAPDSPRWLSRAIIDAFLMYSAAPDELQLAVAQALPQIQGIVTDSSLSVAAGRVLATFERRSSAAPDDALAAWTLAKTLTTIARIQGLRGSDNTLALYEDAMTIIDRFIDEDPQYARWLYVQSEAIAGSCGYKLMQLQDLSPADLGRLTALFTRIERQHGESDDLHSLSMIARLGVLVSMTDLYESGEADPILNQALAASRRSAELAPDDLNAQGLLAHNLALVARRSETDQAHRLARESLAVMRQVVERRPEDESMQAQLADVLYGMTDLAPKDEARGYLEEALVIVEGLADSPLVSALDRVMILDGLADHSDDPDRAWSYGEQAIDALRPLATTLELLEQLELTLSRQARRLYGEGSLDARSPRETLLRLHAVYAELLGVRRRITEARPSDVGAREDVRAATARLSWLALIGVPDDSPTGRARASTEHVEALQDLARLRKLTRDERKDYATSRALAADAEPENRKAVLAALDERAGRLGIRV